MVYVYVYNSLIMYQERWHGWTQKKAQRKTREWVKSLSDADAKRLNINKELTIKKLKNE